MKREDNTNKLGEAIDKARERKGISTPKLAEKVGVRKSTMRLIQIGRTRQPRPGLLSTIAKELDVPAAELFALAGYGTPSELPDLRGWLNVKHRDLAAPAVEALQGHLEYLVSTQQAEADQKELT